MKGLGKKMQKEENIISNGFTPTFLYTWKGIRTVNEEKYHCHDHLEMAFIMSGKGRYKIDGQMYDIEEGDLLIFNPGTYHQAFCVNQKTPTYEFFIGAMNFCLEGMPEDHLLLKSMPVYKCGSDLKQKLMRICTAMSIEREDRKLGRYFMMQAYLVQFLLYILRDEQIPGEPESHCSFESINKNKIVEDIIVYFGEHYSEKISLDMISENMYVSPFYISKIFKSVTGDTPIRYLINIRLDKAKELLEKNPGISVKEVSDMVGYDDAYHFSKLFKKRFGVSPSGIRNA